MAKQTTTLIAASNIMYLADVDKRADSIEEELTEAIQLLKHNTKQTAALFFSIDQKDLRNSPKIDTTPQLVKTNLKQLEKNYKAVLQLTDAMDALSTLEGKLKTSINPSTRGFEDSLANILKLKKVTQDSLNEAYEFLNKLATKHVPAKFETFLEGLTKILEKSISYSKSTTLMFAYTVGEGRLCFTQYIELQELLDEKGQQVPRLYILASFVPDTGEYFVNTQREFEPPSEASLGKPVKTLQEVVRALNVMLDLDKFANAIGSLPMATYLKDVPSAAKLGPQYQVSGVEADSNGISFVLKPTVRKEEVNSIVSDLFTYMKGAVARTRAKLRVILAHEGRNYVVKFFLTRTDNTGDATTQDLEFLRSRFGLAKNQIDAILKTINV